MKQDTHVITSFEKFLSSLTVGKAATFENLTAYPVFTGISQTNGYLLLDEAVKSGKFIITEVNEGGSVPNLKVTNGLGFDVLLLDGDILVGAKQNRSCTTTIIIAKGSSSVIDVNCVERGRWSYKGENFSGDKNPLYSRLRSSKSRSVTENLKHKRGCVADQNEVWYSISEKAASFSKRDAGFEACQTEAADALYSRYESNVKGYEDAFQANDGQVGFIVLIDGKIAGGDIFGNSKVLAKTYGKSLRSYILDAVEQSLGREKLEEVKGDARRKTTAFLGSIRKLKHEPHASTGKGTNIRFEGKTINGFAVMNGDQVVHMAAFRDTVNA